MIQVALTLIFPMFLVSGVMMIVTIIMMVIIYNIYPQVLWPVLAMPGWLQVVASLLPGTHATAAAASLVLRGTLGAALAAKYVQML